MKQTNIHYQRLSENLKTQIRDQESLTASKLQEYQQIHGQYQQHNQQLKDQLSTQESKVAEQAKKLQELQTLNQRVRDEEESSESPMELSLRSPESSGNKSGNDSISTAPRITAITNVKPATISKFGITKWNESETSLLDHLASVHIGLEIAKESGYDSLMVVTSLIFQSLPSRCQWTRSYVSGCTTADQIIRRLVELLEGGRELQLSSFMKCQRKRGEPLLEYFTRSSRIYAFSVGKAIGDIEEDPAAVQFLYQKCMEGMDSSISHEFTKRIENDMDSGKLTLSKLSDAMIRVTRYHRPGTVANMNHGLKEQIASLKADVAALTKQCSSCGKRGHDSQNCWKDIVCGKCSRSGHPTERCRIVARVGTPREPETDGRLEQRSCFHCKQRGHIKRDCPERQKQTGATIYESTSGHPKWNKSN